MKSVFSKIKYPQLIMLVFGTIIILGTALLSLPIASKSGAWTGFEDALFTSTSATCVTGLVIFDTFTYWSLFGQIVILLLVQIGGLGFMSVATGFFLAVRRKIGLSERMFMQEAAGSAKLGGIVKITKHILFGTLCFEALGAVLLAFKFCPEMGFGKGLYYSIFHSVSAFCNAGFDLMGSKKPLSSLESFSGDPYVCIIIASLVVIGSLGFLVWEDLFKNKLHFKKYMLHTKVVLVTTAALIILPTFIIFFAEMDHSMANMPLGEKIVSSFFHSITLRSAGMVTIEPRLFSNGTLFTTILLMLVGGSPGSVSGGIKTSTLFLIIAAAVATFRNRDDITAFKRKVDNKLFIKACSLTVLYLGGAFFAVFLISILQDLPMKMVIFEAFSAIGTVGSTIGATSMLNTASRAVIILLMYFGRVGIISISLAFSRHEMQIPVHYPTENLIIG